MSEASRHEVIQELRDRLRHLEQAHRPEREPAWTGTVLDQVLPGQGLKWGSVIEWLSAGEGAGAATLALAGTAGLLRGGGALVVVDGKGEFYPPAAAGLGIDLDKTVVVRPENSRDALWALEQALRSRAVAVGLGWVEELHDRAFRRLQLAAETGGSLGFLLRPARYRTSPSWADMRLLIEPVPSANVGSVEESLLQKRGQSPGGRGTVPFFEAGQSPGGRGTVPFFATGSQSAIQRRLRAEVLHCRGGSGGEVIELELSDEADHVRLAAPLAHSAPAPRAARA